MKFLFDAFNDRMPPEAQPLIRDAKRLFLQASGHLMLPGPPAERSAAALSMLDRLAQERQPRPVVLWLTRTKAMAEAIARVHAVPLAEAGWRLSPWAEAAHSRIVGTLTIDELEAALQKQGAQIHFGGVEWILIDEAHAWAHTQEGAELQCLLERLERIADIHPRRAGLCAAADPVTTAWVCAGTGRTAMMPEVAPIGQRTRLSLEWATQTDDAALARRIESAQAIMDGGPAVARDAEDPLVQPDPPPASGWVQIGAPETCRELTVRLDRLALHGMPRLSIISRDALGATPPEKLPLELLRSIAVLQLMIEEKYSESLWENRFPARLLLRETQRELHDPRTPAQLARDVLPYTALRGLSKDVYRQVLEHLYEHGYLAESNGALVRTDAFAPPAPPPPEPSAEIVERMRLLLLQKEEYAYLQPAALHALQAARALAAQHGLTGVAAIEWRADVLLVPWMHGGALALLTRMLERGWAPELNMKRVERMPYGLKIRMSADTGRLLEKLRELRREPVRAEKFVEPGDELPGLEGMLPQALAMRAYEAEMFDAKGLHRWAMRMFV